MEISEINNMSILGVIGGMGPMATVRFLERITTMTYAKTDQQHLDMIVYSIPFVPDRTAFLQGISNSSPLPPVLKTCKSLESAGASCIAVPCVTMSCFMDELRKGVNIPIIDIIDETVSVLSKARINSAGIMATDGTLAAGRLQHMLESAGINPVIPDSDMQKNIMHIIYDNVKHDHPVELYRFRAAANSLFSKGAQCVILGCTELSIVKRDYDIGSGFIDTIDVLALSCIKKCGAKVNPRYTALIS